MRKVDNPKILHIQLTDREFQKIADEAGISQYVLQKLSSIGLLREPRMLDLLIRSDFKKISRTKNYRRSQIITRLEMFYHVPRARVCAAISNAKFYRCYCEECGKMITKSEFNRNEGLCDTCVAASIEIP